MRYVRTCTPIHGPKWGIHITNASPAPSQERIADVPQRSDSGAYPLERADRNVRIATRRRLVNARCYVAIDDKAMYLKRALRSFFRHDRRLLAEVSRLIYDILRDFYQKATGRPLLTGMVIAHQSFGDQLRWNPDFHAIVLEGGFDDEGTFFYILFSGLQSMVEAPTAPTSQSR